MSVGYIESNFVLQNSRWWQAIVTLGIQDNMLYC